MKMLVSDAVAFRPSIIDSTELIPLVVPICIWIEHKGKEVNTVGNNKNCFPSRY